MKAELTQQQHFQTVQCWLMNEATDRITREDWILHVQNAEQLQEEDFWPTSQKYSG